jgi:hypothetical protein
MRNKKGKSKRGEIKMRVQRVRMRSGIAGYSRDHRTIFVDVLVKDKDLKPIVKHEEREINLLNQGYDYNTAHREANQEEKKYVKGSLKRYQKRMRKTAKRIYSRKIGHDPKDLWYGNRWNQYKHKRSYYKGRRK